MATNRCKLAFLTALLCLASSLTLAQVATGFPPFAPIESSSFDSVDLDNLNVHFSIPIVQKQGRGLPFTYILSYDSSIWYKGTSGSSFQWQPVTNWGWHIQTDAATGWINYAKNTTNCLENGNVLGGTTTTYSGWVYHDTSGTAHNFTGITKVVTNFGGTNNTCPPNQTTSLTSTTADGSGYTLHASGASGTITGRGGMSYAPPIANPNGAGTITDRNGNQISVNSSGAYTDTLSTPVLTVSGTSPNPTTYKYTSPAGTQVAFTINYKQYTVSPLFGCSGFTQWGPNSEYLVDNIQLPDGKTYNFTYEVTPADAHTPHYVTARIASAKLPTGGTISYTYSGGNNGIECSDGSAAGLSPRSTPDGSWVYTRSVSSDQSTVTVKEPSGDQFVVYSKAGQETERDIYQHLSTTAVRKSIYTCYNGAAYPCNSTTITQPVTTATVTTKEINAQGTQNQYSQQVTTLNSTSGLPTEEDDYGYGFGAVGGLLRKTLITYASLTNGILDKPATVVVKDVNNGVWAQTTYGYDEYAVATTSEAQHVTVSGSRGNVTTINYLIGTPPQTGVSNLYKHFTYNDTGTINTAYDYSVSSTTNGTATTYSYAGTSCGNAFPTSSTAGGLTQLFAWNCTGGVLASTTDPNNNPITYTYNDPYFWRPASIKDQAQNVTSFTYTGETQVESSLPVNGSTSAVDVVTTLDSLGRVHFRQTRLAPPSGGNFDTIETDYDNQGRVSRVTIPYTGTLAQANGSVGATTYTYDVLGRAATTDWASGDGHTYNYDVNDAQAILTGQPSGENAKTRQYEYDPLGRLTSVCEIVSGTGVPSCGQNSTVNNYNGYVTLYSYNPKNDLNTVTQKGDGSATQTRSYTYDGIGRLIQEANPETNPATYTAAYTYDSDATCGTSAGDLIKRVDANGTTTCYTYDSLHRITGITYTLGVGVASTPNKYFAYDAGNQPGTTTSVANPKGRMVEAYTATCSTCSKVTDTVFGYSPRGEISDEWESTPNSAGYYHLSATYWPHGPVDQLTIPGVPVLTYNVDSEGRVNQVAAASGTNPVTSVAYGASNRPDAATALTFGSGDNDSFSYDPTTGQMTQFQYNVGATPQSLIGILSWNGNLTLGQLQITDQLNSPATETCAYAHDDLARLASANCVNGTTNVWNQNFSYGSFGNITKTVPTGGTGTSFQPTYDQTTNRFTAVPGATPTYDANGNLKYDGSLNYSWDGENRPATLNGFGLTVDALGRIVEKNSSGSYLQYVFSPTGRKIAVYAGQTLKRTYIPLPAGAEVNYGSSGISAYAHADWLGSIRVASSPGRAVLADIPYAPYGETYSRTGTYSPEFTGQELDITSPLYDFLSREHNYTQGRWISPDPAGIGAVDPTNPQSWNRYAYVGGNPLASIDPNGTVTLPCDLDICGGGGGGGWCGDPESDIFTCFPILPPPIPIGGGGGGGSGSGGSGGGGTGGTGGSGGGGGGPSPISFPNGENLGLPTGYHFKALNIFQLLGLEPIQQDCEFGTCLPGLEGFVGGSGLECRVICEYNRFWITTLTQAFQLWSYFAKGGRQNIVPSWAEGQRPLPGESAADFAKRLCDQRYGPGNYDTGPGKEYSKIKKWARDKFGI